MAKKTEAELKLVPQVTPLTARGLDGADYITFDDYYDLAVYRLEIGYDMKKEDVYNFEYEKVKNYERIVRGYNLVQKIAYAEDIKKNKPKIIQSGVTLYFPNKSVRLDLQGILGSDIFLPQSKFKAFWNENQKKMIEDKGYVRFDDFSETGVKKTLTEIQAKSLNVRVWVYVEALKDLYDISRFVSLCETSKGFNVGNFSIEVTPIDTLEGLENTDEFINQFNIMTKDGKLNRDWFSRFIQYNDLVYIRYEKLQMESEVEGRKISNSPTTFKIPLSDLKSDLVWDMIGLVDSVSISVDSESTNYSVNIVGKDLTKLLAEDGSYFLPLKFVEGSPDRWFYGGDPKSQWYQRNFISGNFDEFAAFEFKTIRAMLDFYLGQISKIQIIDDSVLAASKVTSGVGIWQIVRVYTDMILDDRRIVDKSLINPEGTFLDLCNKICQSPFVEFWGDTWGSEFDFTVRQPPFTKASIEDVVKSETYITIAPENTYAVSLSYDERAYAWYRLMPQNDFLGKSQYSSLAFVPILYFEKFCKRFGNKRCMVNDIYLSMKSINGHEASMAVNTFSDALMNDLLLVIESDSYLPFTRKGTITLNGDRRIKVGTFVKLDVTDELFYVIDVNNSISFENNSVDRQTTITVERGMDMDLIQKTGTKKYESKKFTYFDIIKIEEIRKDILGEVAILSNKESLGASNGDGVNEDAFDFFVNRTFNK